MHSEQQQFVRLVKRVFPAHFHRVAVLEVGSYDVNGSVRPMFDASRHLGIDLVAGPAVDLVCSGHEFRSEERFDVAVSTECFEHNPFYAETFLNMVRHVRPGGMVLFTCASEGRPEHGTGRCDPASSPGSAGLFQDYYRNLTEADFAGLDMPSLFSEFCFLRNAVAHDLYFVGITPDAGRMDRLAALHAESERLDAAFAAAMAQCNLAQRDGAAQDEALRQLRGLCDRAAPEFRAEKLARFAWLALAAGRADAAEAAVREALDTADGAELHWQLGTILHSGGRTARALRSAERAVSRAPGDARFAYFLGAMLQDQNQLARAEELLQRALRLDPGMAGAYLQLSMVRIKQARWAEATEAARRALGLAPDMAGLRQHLERLLSRPDNRPDDRPEDRPDLRSVPPP